MTEEHHGEDALLLRARQGDDDALGELIERYRTLLQRMTSQKLVAVQARIHESDVIQMTFWSAFRGFPRFEGDCGGFAAWIQQLHEQNLRDAVRRQLAAKRAVGREVALSQPLPDRAARQTSPSQNLYRVELRTQLADCIDHLPLAQREAIKLRFFDGLSVAEIVERMGRSETAIAGLLKRGLSALRKMVPDE